MVLGLFAMQLIAMVEKVFNNYPSEKMNRIWQSYLMNLQEVIEHHADNKYKVPHTKTRKLECKGRLPLGTETGINYDSIILIALVGEVQIFFLHG